MQVIQTNSFKKVYKKLAPNHLKPVNDAIKAIMANPDVGKQKHGDLDWLAVYKFKINNCLTLLGYTVAYNYDDTVITLIALGPHENFYRDIKRK